MSVSLGNYRWAFEEGNGSLMRTARIASSANKDPNYNGGLSQSGLAARFAVAK